MYIIPLEVKPSLRNVPLVTLLLIAINIMLFAWHDAYDHKIYDKGLEYYSSSGLDRDEFPVLKEYLMKNPRFDWPEDLFENAESNPRIRSRMAAIAYYSRDFSEYIKDRRIEKVKADPAYLPLYNAWLERRLELDRIRASSVSGRYAYTPADNKPVTWITCMFLHGSWEHVVGNMLFLLLFGWGLEFILGSMLYLFVYIAAGVIATLTHGIFNAGSLTSLVGASGAVSGVMGAYVGYFGLRKINFFYNFGFYFGKLRAPAIAVLGFYLVKELYGTFFANDNVAYLAHFGGFIGGAGLVWALSHLQKQYTKSKGASDAKDTPVKFGSQEFHHYKEKENELARLQTHFLSISQSKEQLDLDSAERKMFKALEEFPTDTILWKSLYDTASIRIHSKSYQQTTLAIIKHFLKLKALTEEQSSFLVEMLVDYEKHAPHKLLLKNTGLLTSLSTLFLKRQNARGAKLTLKYLLELERENLSQKTKGLAQQLSELLRHSKKVSDVRYREKLSLIAA